MNDNNLTATEFALKVGVQKNAVSEWKSKRISPTAEALAKIADYFNVSVDYLLGRVDMPAALAYQIPYEDANPRGVRFVDGLEGLSKSDIDDIRNYIEFKRTRNVPSPGIDAPEGWNILDNKQQEFIIKLMKDQIQIFLAEKKQAVQNHSSDNKQIHN